MDKRKATQNELKKAFNEHADKLRRFIMPFTDDKFLTERILHMVLHEIPLIKKRPGTNIDKLYRINQLARNVALAFQESDATFDKFAKWKQEPNYYQFSNKSHTRRHKDIFNYIYYRNASYAEVAQHFKISEEEVFTLFKQAADSITEFYEGRITELTEQLDKPKKKIDSS